MPDTSLISKLPRKGTTAESNMILPISNEKAKAASLSQQAALQQLASIPELQQKLASMFGAANAFASMDDPVYGSGQRYTAINAMDAAQRGSVKYEPGTGRDTQGYLETPAANKPYPTAITQEALLNEARKRFPSFVKQEQNDAFQRWYPKLLNQLNDNRLMPGYYGPDQLK